MLILLIDHTWTKAGNKHKRTVMKIFCLFVKITVTFGVTVVFKVKMRYRSSPRILLKNLAFSVKVLVIVIKK